VSPACPRRCRAGRRGCGPARPGDAGPDDEGVVRPAPGVVLPPDRGAVLPPGRRAPTSSSRPGAADVGRHGLGEEVGARGDAGPDDEGAAWPLPGAPRSRSGAAPPPPGCRVASSPGCGAALLAAERPLRRRDRSFRTSEGTVSVRKWALAEEGPGRMTKVRPGPQPGAARPPTRCRAGPPPVRRAGPPPVRRAGPPPVRRAGARVRASAGSSASRRPTTRTSPRPAPGAAGPG